MALTAAGSSQLSLASTKHPITGDQIVVTVKGGKTLTKSITCV